MNGGKKKGFLDANAQCRKRKKKQSTPLYDEKDQRGDTTGVSTKAGVKKAKEKGKSS